MGFFYGFKAYFALFVYVRLIKGFSSLTGFFVELAANVLQMFYNGAFVKHSVAKEIINGNCTRGNIASPQKRGWYLECENPGKSQTRKRIF
jgi:hypothetical protein